MDQLLLPQDSQYLQSLDEIDWAALESSSAELYSTGALPNYHVQPEATSETPRITQTIQPVQGHAETRKSRTSLACVSCRGRHSKCDAQRPSCSRCRRLGRVCSYGTSRRGKYKLGETARASSPIGGVWDSSVALSTPIRPAEPTGGSTSHFHTTNQISRCPSSSDADDYLDVYYDNFHPAHPFVVPRAVLRRRLADPRTNTPQLRAAMQYVASFYSSTPQQGALRAQLDAALDADFEESGFIVQALLVSAIVFHATDEFVLARRTLDHAIDVALRLRMFSRVFSAQHSGGCKVTEESWRRTWWCLYVTDSIFSAIRHASSFALHATLTDVDLPCEEIMYELGQVPPSRTMEEYDNREFSRDESASFSSFTYLIDLVQILGSTLALDRDSCDALQPGVVDTEARLMSWIMYLPETKRRLASTEHEGMIDEVLFQAHIVYNTLRVRLHRPLSALRYSTIEHQSTCAPPPSNRALPDEEQPTFDFHTAKVLEAAQAGIGMFIVQARFTSHSPILMCGLNICLLAQLAACCSLLKGTAFSSARDRVRFGLSVLKAFGFIWPLGRSTWKETKEIALEVLALSHREEE